MHLGQATAQQPLRQWRQRLLVLARRGRLVGSSRRVLQLLLALRWQGVLLKVLRMLRLLC